ncbi:MAG TPA: cupin domain-containing protein [Verrucomicrobiae bacterium]|nr:cupin domain-containing protein [Verrucomicrobiae bacterium]
MVTIIHPAIGADLPFDARRFQSPLDIRVNPGYFGAMATSSSKPTGLSPLPPVVVPPNGGAVFSAVGDVYRLLAGSAQTGGAYALLESRVLPGGGPPPHLHTREEEAFFVLEGEISFFLEDQKIAARPGSFVHIPRGMVHAFKNESTKPARMLIQTSPAGFESFIQEIAHPLPSFDSSPAPVTQQDVAKLLAVAPKYGIEVRLPQA